MATADAPRGPSLLKHCGAAVLFSVLPLIWTYPLLFNLSTHVPGRGVGDNVSFVWNAWWMRTALSSGADVFFTTYLFAPIGADLTLNTHTALSAWVGATALRSLTPVAALNVTILASLFLNGFCAYLLAWRVTKNHGAALIGGLVFSCSAYLAAHLEGHFNLTAAWPIPLFAIAALEAARGSLRAAALAGVVLGLTAYVDYYYVVFEFGLGLSIVALTAYGLQINPKSSPATPWRRTMRVVAVMIAIDVALMLAIKLTGGWDIRIGSQRIVLRGIYNELQIFWVLVAVLVALRFWPRLRLVRLPGSKPVRAVAAGVVALIVFTVVAAPIVGHAYAMVRQGDYVTQQYFWRSSPEGVDLSTLVLGNPSSSLLGAFVRTLYDALQINPIESVGWLGVVPTILAAWVIRRRRSSSADVRLWIGIGAMFFVWALGPHLLVFGHDTKMILPQAMARYVPILNNARIPGRGMVVVTLATGVLAAIAVAEWRMSGGRRRAALLIASVLIIADGLPAPFPITRLDHPALYDTLRDRAEPGAVVELPMGLADGFGQRGQFDNHALVYQMIHGRALVGGFMARIPTAVQTAYDADPLLAALLALSDPAPHADASAPALPDPALALQRLRQDGIAFVVLNRALAPQRLINYVDHVMPLALITREGDRSLYLVSR